MQINSLVLGVEVIGQMVAMGQRLRVTVEKRGLETKKSSERP